MPSLVKIGEGQVTKTMHYVPAPPSGIRQVLTESQPFLAGYQSLSDVARRSHWSDSAENHSEFIFRRQFRPKSIQFPRRYTGKPLPDIQYRLEACSFSGTITFHLTRSLVPEFICPNTTTKSERLKAGECGRYGFEQESNMSLPSADMICDQLPSVSCSDSDSKLSLTMAYIKFVLGVCSTCAWSAASK